MTRIGYLAHDLADAAVRRRVVMLEAAGAEVAVAGFLRGSSEPPAIGSAHPLLLGRTEDARLARRIPNIARVSLLSPGRIARHLGDVDAIIARNLEMLAIALRVIGRLKRRPRLVYECLDIHRLLTDPGPSGRLLRHIERRLAPSVDLVLTSSPAFVRNHLGKHALSGRILLAENKVVINSTTPEPAPPTPSGPSWKIGWFGALRCRRSFEMLSELAERASGTVEIVLRGRPSPAVFPDFGREVAGRRHMRFEGPYRNPEDLARIYGDVHFAWCIDFYEEGANSAWLLPNRLYESGFHSTVPIALAHVETGQFMSRNGFGILLDDVSTHRLLAIFEDMTPSRYALETALLGRQPRRLWAADAGDCAALLDAVLGRDSARHTTRVPA